MINLSRTQLAAGGTILALSALAAIAVGAQSDTSALTAQKTIPAEVRTVIVHRTVRVTKHRKPKKASAEGSGATTASGAAPGYSSGAPAVVPVSSQPTYPAPKPAPVQSQTSGYGGGSGGESEGSDDGSPSTERNGGDD